jgi:hypothetical protein
MICPNYLLTHFNAAAEADPLTGLVFSFGSIFDDGPFITDTPAGCDTIYKF